MSFKDLVNNQIVPVADQLVNLLYALAFIFFIIGLTRYVILGGGNEETREKGKTFMLWAFIGLVVLFSVWGIVKLLLSVLPS